MLDEETILRTKRALSDADDLLLVGNLTPPRSSPRETPSSRPNRAFSWTKLTETIRSRALSTRSSRSSKGASSPRLPFTSSFPIAPWPSVYIPPQQQIAALRKARIADGSIRHTHSTSDPTNNTSPCKTRSRKDPRSRPAPVPPVVPTHISSGDSLLDSSLERITESSLESITQQCEDPDLNLQSSPSSSTKSLQPRMEPARLQPPIMGGTKGRAIQQAKEMEALVAERAKRSGGEPPPYDFYELIGKGAYGRVFKGKSRKTGGLVAIKIIDIDTVDYEEMTTKNLSETLKEIDILQQLRDSKARSYVNIIEEARPVHNELWIVSEYASGGSVNTLMKPYHAVKDPGPGLPEKYIIPIARELARGLKYTHEAGVLHRDLKSNNVLILEDGRVQLCDFGVSGILEPTKSKRTTIVGTPYWMAPELQKEWIKEADPKSHMKPKEIQYGSEVDIWAYGCTIYEMASGFPPFHKTVQWDLPTAGIPVLEGARYSAGLKEFVEYLLQPEASSRPTADEILQHPYLAGTTATHPTGTLVGLVEEFYNWEQGGGARASLFNPFGAQAPDPLAPESEDDDDDDWTFSTSDEFQLEHVPQFADPFAAPGTQPFSGMNIPPIQDMGRFEQLQARFKEESIQRGQNRLNKLFDTNTTPYRYSAIDGPEPSNGRPPSDLVLRDFNPGAPNRETVIDLDFSMPSTEEIPSIDLGEVPTIRANRMKSILREMEEEERQDALMSANEYPKRATKDWTFPEMNDDSNRKTMEWSFPGEQANRKTMEWSFPVDAPSKNRTTMEWSFPAQPQKPNRRTVEWTFDAAMAEANNEAPRNRTSRRRETKEWTYPKQAGADRATRDFAFPLDTIGEDQRRKHSKAESSISSSSPTLVASTRTTLHDPSDEPLSLNDGFPRLESAPDSPLRTSMIDLDIAMVDDYRPSTSGSDTTYTAGTERTDNPFNLEDQVQLSQNNHRASFHTKSQSEPNHAVPGLLTPQQYDEQGQPTNQDPHHPSMHARGVSSASQVQGLKVPPSNIAHRSNQRSQQTIWDGWSHAMAYGLGSDDQSPPMSVTTDTSLEEEDVDDLWDTFDRLHIQRERRQQAYAPLRSARRTDSSSTSGFGLDSDTDDAYPYSSDSAYDDLPPPNPVRKSVVSVGPNGKPLVEFAVPHGPGAEAFLGVGMDIRAMQEMLLKSAIELRDGTRASRDLLRAMRLEEVTDDGEQEDGGMTVRMRGSR